PLVLHLCTECARKYLQTADQPEQAAATASFKELASQFSLESSEEEISQAVCPICGISFPEFREKGRLGCPHDYVIFQQELEPLLLNVHGAAEHSGKQPKRWPKDTDDRTQLIRLRREMVEAINEEDYERASQLRDRIQQLSDSKESGQ
ncbi:MAG: UvrB/UvrC motif-containing protein, partial [Planctomycetales bacterium]